MGITHLPRSRPFGTRAATESITKISTAPLRTSISAISKACSPVSGWETRSSSHSHAQLLGVFGIQSVFSVYKGGNASTLLNRCNCMQRQGGLAGRFRAEYLNNPSPWEFRRSPGPCREPEILWISRAHPQQAAAQLHDGSFSKSGARSDSWRPRPLSVFR